MYAVYIKSEIVTHKNQQISEILEISYHLFSLDDLKLV